MDDLTPPDTSAIDHLFVYGTLLPGQPRWSFLEPFVVDEGRVDEVPGAVYDTGRGYPAARFGPVAQFGPPAGPGGDGIIRGRTFRLAADRLHEALRVLDDVEGAVAGLYTRVVVATSVGTSAFAYEYGAGLELDLIESGSWVDHVLGRAGRTPSER